LVPGRISPQVVPYGGGYVRSGVTVEQSLGHWATGGSHADIGDTDGCWLGATDHLAYQRLPGSRHRRIRVNDVLSLLTERQERKAGHAALRVLRCRTTHASLTLSDSPRG